MERGIPMIVLATILTLTTSVQSAGVASTPTPSPAPAPAPADVNLTQLLSVAGPFSTFLSYLESTKVITTFQNQANNSEQGLTVFVPTDSAFSNLKSPSLKNLTSDQLKSLCLFHGIPQFLSLSDFKKVSLLGPVSSFAGGQYTLNFTDVSGTVHITTGWSNTKISSSVFSTAPVAIYQVNKVLLPEAIFGTDIPPTAAPAPAPDSPVADSPAPSANAKSGSSSSNSSSAPLRLGAWSSLVLPVFGGAVLFW